MALPTVATGPQLWDVGQYIVVVDSIGTSRIIVVAGDYVLNVEGQPGLSIQNLSKLMETL